MMKHTKIFIVPFLILLSLTLAFAQEETISVSATFAEPTESSEPTFFLNNLMAFISNTQKQSLTDLKCQPSGAYSLSGSGEWQGANINFMSKDGQIVTWGNKNPNTQYLGGKCAVGQVIDVIQCNSKSSTGPIACDRVFNDFYVKSTSTDNVDISKVNWVPTNKYVGYTCWTCGADVILYSQATSQDEVKTTATTTNTPTVSGKADLQIIKVEVPETVKAGDLVDAKFTVKNNGNMAGEEVIGFTYLKTSALGLSSTISNYPNVCTGTYDIAAKRSVLVEAGTQSVLSTQIRVPSNKDTFKLAANIVKPGVSIDAPEQCQVFASTSNSAGISRNAILSNSFTTISTITPPCIGCDGEDDDTHEDNQTLSNLSIKLPSIEASKIKDVTKQERLASTCTLSSQCENNNCVSYESLIADNYLSNSDAETYVEQIRDDVRGAGAGATIAGAVCFVGIAASPLTLGTSLSACAAALPLGAIAGASFSEYVNLIQDESTKTQNSKLGLCVVESNPIDDFANKYVGPLLPEKYKDYAVPLMFLAGLLVVYIVFSAVGGKK